MNCMKPIDEDVLSSLQTHIDMLINNARPNLEVNIEEIVNSTFNKIDVEIETNPENLANILSTQFSQFCNEYNDDEDFNKVWFKISKERMLTRWIPKCLQKIVHSYFLFQNIIFFMMLFYL